MIDLVAQDGWTYFECRECYEVIYEGNRIGLEDLGDLVQVHAFACAAMAGGTQP